jgi:photosystem II stability/assembly factor-like uncharacterized protein
MFSARNLPASSLLPVCVAVCLFLGACQDECPTCPRHHDSAPVGWFVQATPIDLALRAVHAIDASTIVAVGDLGTILRSTNGGASWASISSGTTERLGQVSFVDAMNGWIAATNGLLLKSEDSGATWTAKNPGIPTHFRDVCFVDQNTGWAGGSEWGPVTLEGHIIKTTDGGETWESQLAVSGNGLFFIDAQNGCVAGGDGHIHRTTDGGANWSDQDIGAPAWLGSVFFVDANIGYVAGSGGFVAKTIDGGATWTIQADGTERTVADIEFVDASKGWFVAGSPGTIGSTLDGGQNWSFQTVPTLPGLADLSFVDANTGWIVGNEGIILKTVTGGIIPQ